MKFLLDENIGHLTAKFLRSKGYDIKSAIEEFKGFGDEEILAIARQEERILITLDQDFGKLIYQNKSPHRGVILLKLKKESQGAIIKVLEEAITQLGEELEGKFIIITEDRVRIK